MVSLQTSSKRYLNLTGFSTVESVQSGLVDRPVDQLLLPLVSNLAAAPDNFVALSLSVLNALKPLVI